MSANQMKQIGGKCLHSNELFFYYNRNTDSDFQYLEGLALYSVSRIIQFKFQVCICWCVDGKIMSAMGMAEEVFSVPMLVLGGVPGAEVQGAEVLRVQDMLLVGLLCQQLVIPILVGGVLFVEIRHTSQMFAQTVETDAPHIISPVRNLHVVEVCTS